MDDYIKIPRLLHNSGTKLPFSNCMVCNKYLLGPGTPYMIEKSIRQVPEMKFKETLFEYAMCIDCSVMMNSALSVESRKRIDAYFLANTGLEQRQARLAKRKTVRFQNWISRCIVKKTPITAAREYQIVGLCDGENLVMSHMPFAISVEAMEEITELLSEKSLGEIDGFIGKYFTGPPEVSEILKKRLVLI
jgi:hypothetical protein